MNNEKTGILIRRLRRERNMTQKQVADALHVSDRAVSKWERGCDLNQNDTDGGNMKRIKLYRCASCGNILTSTSDAELSCCGRLLEPLEVQSAAGEHVLSVEEIEDEYYVQLDHPMEKGHHIAFVACATDERIVLVRMYPEQGAQARFPRMPRSTWYACCTEHGLFSFQHI